MIPLVSVIPQVAIYAHVSQIVRKQRQIHIYYES